MKKLFTLLLVAAVSVTSFAQKYELTVHKNDAAKEIQFPTNDRAEGEWIYWDKANETENSIGTGGAATFMVGSRWTDFDIDDYNGWKITKMSFIAGDNAFAVATYVLKIWAPGGMTELYSQDVDVAAGATWLEFELDEPFTIDASQELWFGYWIDTPSGHPAGCDAGPAVKGKGDKIRFDDPEEVWENLSDLSASLNYNWSLRAYVEGGNSVETLGGYQVNAYPNPFTNEIQFDGNVSQVIIHNLIGQEVMNVKVNGTSVSTSDLSNGVYMVTFQNEIGERSIRKMIKQ